MDFDLIGIYEKFTDIPVAVFLIILITTFVLEDLATTAAAAMAAAGDVSVPLALMALLTGIIGGDIALYFLGRYGASFQYAKKMLVGRRVRLARKWLHKRMIMAVMMSRFMPGMRAPMFVTVGFLHLPFKKFLIIILLAGVAWTFVLFFTTYYAGLHVMDWKGPWKWAALGGVALSIILLPHVLNASWSLIRTKRP